MMRSSVIDLSYVTQENSKYLPVFAIPNDLNDLKYAFTYEKCCCSCALVSTPSLDNSTPFRFQFQFHYASKEITGLVDMVFPFPSSFISTSSSLFMPKMHAIPTYLYFGYQIK